MDRLDPKLDIVFKLLMTREPKLLHAMLEAVLEKKIADLTVLNPGIPGELSNDKGVVLDVRVELTTGDRVDVEMQIRIPPAFASRLIYYCARDYADQLHRGDEYAHLTPTIAIVWVVEPLFPKLLQLHSVFELRERASHLLFSDHLAIHLLQLSCLDLPSHKTGQEEETAVRRWARFLVARTEAEFNQLAKEDPIMNTAKNALEKLSQDPEAYRLARERADAMKLYELEIAESHRKGIETGIEKGIEKERRSMLRRHLVRKFGPLPEWADHRLETANAEELQRMDDALFEPISLENIMKFIGH